MFEKLFFTVIDMSFAASVAAILVIIARRIFSNKLPQILNYALWAIVLIRLLVPFSVPSPWSIYNTISMPETIVERFGQHPTSEAAEKTNDGQITVRENSGDPSKGNEQFTESVQTPYPSAGTDQDITRTLAWIWLFGSIALLIFSVFAYLRASRRLNESVLYPDNHLIASISQTVKMNRKVRIYTSDRIHTPIVCGLFNVRIILPLAHMASLTEIEIKHMITHELIHIKRRDHLIKPLAVLALCIHWFNPLIWLSFILSQKDMEISCDASVLSINQSDIRREYANSLIHIATKQNILFNGGLLAFGEKNIKSRVKGIMCFKKAKVWMGAVVILVIAAFSFILLTNGQNGSDIAKFNRENRSPLAMVDQNMSKDLLLHRSRYIGDASNVSNLLNKLPYGKNKKGISLKTESRPYGLTVNYRFDDMEVDEGIEPVLYDNALILFSLIENVETIHFNISSANHYEFTFTREEMQGYFDKKLWAYSEDNKSFTEFLMDISFKILVFPKGYSPAISVVPGLQLDTSLNAAIYRSPVQRKYKVKEGTLHTWNGLVSEGSKEVTISHGSVYWRPAYYEENTGKEDIVTISLLNDKGDILFEKQIVIVQEVFLYSVKPSYDIIFSYVSHSEKKEIN